MLEWYYSLLSPSQIFAVWLVLLLPLWIGVGVWLGKATGDSESGNAVGFAAALFLWPVIWGLGSLILGFIDLIGWLWTH